MSAAASSRTVIPVGVAGGGVGDLSAANGSGSGVFAAAAVVSSSSSSSAAVSAAALMAELRGLEDRVEVLGEEEGPLVALRLGAALEAIRDAPFKSI
jgi:hypothetical protein